MLCDLLDFFSFGTGYEIEAHQCINDNQCTVYTGTTDPQDIFNFTLTSRDGTLTKEIKTDIDFWEQKVYFNIQNYGLLEVSIDNCNLIDNNSLYIKKNSTNETITILIKKLV